MSAWTRPEHPAHEVRLVAEPRGLPAADWFALRETPIPVPGAGEVLVRVHALSLDPYLRTAIVGRHIGHDSTSVGSVMPGRSVAQVVEGGSAGLPNGSWVLAETGWREYAVLPATQVHPVDPPPGVSLSAMLSVLGMPGLTAYAAIVRHLLPRPGDTVVVSAATGGVGSVAGQLAAAQGARTVAVVGDDWKAEVATSRLGYDAAVVRGRDDFPDALAAATPDRIDAYLHLGSEDVLEAVIGRLAVGARVSLCGLMEQYNDGPVARMPVGPLIGARATVHGMVVYDHEDLIPEQLERLGEQLRSGELVLVEDRSVGLDSAPEAFVRLMSGRNRGKSLVEVAPA